jgi:HSP20 family protein
MTSLIRWSANPARDLLGIRDEVDRLFETAFPPSPRWSGDPRSAFAPAVDIEETRDEFVVRADLPGVSPQDVKVSVLADVLTIRGERKQQQEHKDQNVHRVERRYGSFERSFRLGVPVRSDQVKASVRDGVLEIHVPKAEEARMREIEVQVAS